VRTVCDLEDRVEEAHPEDDLPPLASQDVVFEEIAGDLREGASHVGSEAFGRLVGHLARTTTTTTTTTRQRDTRLDCCDREKQR